MTAPRCRPDGPRNRRPNQSCRNQSCPSHRETRRRHPNRHPPPMRSPSSRRCPRPKPVESGSCRPGMRPCRSGSRAPVGTRRWRPGRWRSATTCHCRNPGRPIRRTLGAGWWRSGSARSRRCPDCSCPSHSRSSASRMSARYSLAATTSSQHRHPTCRNHQRRPNRTQSRPSQNLRTRHQNRNQGPNPSRSHYPSRSGYHHRRPETSSSPCSSRWTTPTPNWTRPPPRPGSPCRPTMTVSRRRDRTRRQ